MPRLLLIAATMTVMTLNTFGADCSTVIQVRHRTRDGKEEFTVKNVSGKPIIAYVIANDERDPSGNASHVFYGVFTDGDSLRPGDSMEISSVSSDQLKLTPSIDYVRLAGGWSCGAASTEQTKEIVMRLSK